MKMFVLAGAMILIAGCTGPEKFSPAPDAKCTPSKNGDTHKHLIYHTEIREWEEMHAETKWSLIDSKLVDDQYGVVDVLMITVKCEGR